MHFIVEHASIHHRWLATRLLSLSSCQEVLGMRCAAQAPTHPLRMFMPARMTSSTSSSCDATTGALSRTCARRAGWRWGARHGTQRVEVPSRQERTRSACASISHCNIHTDRAARFGQPLMQRVSATGPAAGAEHGCSRLTRPGRAHGLTVHACTAALCARSAPSAPTGCGASAMSIATVAVCAYVCVE